MHASLTDQATYETIQDAADRIGVSTKTIRRKIADGSLPAYRLGTSIIRLRSDDVEGLLRPIPTAGRCA